MEVSRVARPEKVAIVEELKDKLTQAQAVVLTDYRGLNVQEITELRKQLREAGIEYKVVKNTLTTRAANEVDLPELAQYLAGPTAIAFGFDEPVSAAKILNEFARTHKALEIKGGVLEGRVIGVEEVRALADLPSREQLLGMVARAMQGPIAGMAIALSGVIRGLAYALNAVREQKEGAGA
jgi:large subunit ribosomal protein L10